METKRTLNASETESQPLKRVKTDAAPIAKYVPPFRAANDKAAQIQKQVKRLLNKLSVSNLESILSDFEQLYHENSRNGTISCFVNFIIYLQEVNKFMCNLILDLCCDTNLVLAHNVSIGANAALVALLHNIIGQEVGGHFIESVVVKFNESYNNNKNKECSNLLIMLSNLYNFQVAYCGLIYDLIRVLLKSFKELDVELLLILLKYSGPQLRNDDPAGLKDIILLVKEQASKHSINLEDSTSTSSSSSSSTTPDQPAFNLRAKFMVQTIYDLKNNKQRANEDNSNMLSIKKNIKSILNKKGIQGENTLRVSLEELLNAKDKGRWWIVGSAWAGNGPANNTPASSSSKRESGQNESSFDIKILNLAKEHHMNTDIRKAIFCTIMSSEDYVDAFEKLMKLNLKGKQDREIVSVLIYCAIQEKKFNEFYAHLCTKFCTLSHSFRFTFQTAFWDKFKETDSLGLRCLSNLATLLAKLVAASALSLSVLKVVEFPRLSSHSIVFFRLFFTNLLTSNDQPIVDAVFQRILSQKDSTSLQVKEGIGHFFLQELMHMNNSSTQQTQQQILYKKQMKQFKKQLEKSLTEEVFDFE